MSERQRPGSGEVSNREWTPIDANAAKDFSELQPSKAPVERIVYSRSLASIRGQAPPSTGSWRARIDSEEGLRRSRTGGDFGCCSAALGILRFFVGAFFTFNAEGLGEDW